MATISVGDIDVLLGPGGFDPEWYGREYPDVAMSGMSPAEHYLWIGRRLGRKPVSPAGTPLASETAPRQPSRRELARRSFGTAHAAIQHALTTASARVQAVDLMRGAPRDRTRWLGFVTRFIPRARPSLFNRKWLERQSAGDAPISWQRYRRTPRLHRLDPHPLFSVDHYLSQLPENRRHGVQPLLHYLDYGWREGLSPHPYFANDWYLAQNPDLLSIGMNPLEHYILHGAAEKRWPNPLFDPAQYLARNPDVARDGMNPLLHYVVFGAREGRIAPMAPQPGITTEDLYSMVGTAGSADPMAYLLCERAVPSPAADEPLLPAVSINGPLHDAWPPAPLDDYWLPNAMREYLLDTRGTDVLPLYWYLYSVIARHNDRKAAFAGSSDCAVLVERCRVRAAARDGRPRVSIIVPVHNNILDTLCCIVSLLEDETRTSYEVVVADDASGDGTADVIGAIGGRVRYEPRTENVGFLLNCNMAVAATRGEIVVLLNNDTLVLPGWLDALVAPFDDMDEVGLTGSKLLNWNGTLQEAGGIYWNDGSAWNFGRNQDARAPQFNYLKDVDYCSGASIAIPRVLWDALDGFDRLYLPAYCEDADLAFRVRAAGYRTLYQPLSEVIHHEGRSHGQDTTQGIKAHQVTNQARLLERWRETLADDHYANAENVFRARDRSGRKPHILVVDHYIPQPDKDAGSRSTLQLVKTLVEMGFAVCFWPDNLYRDQTYIHLLQQIGVEVIYGAEYQGRFAEFMDDRRGLYDAVLLSRPHIAAQFIDVVRTTPGLVRLFYGHDLHFCRMASGKGSGASDVEIARMRDLELDICRKVDVPFYPSQEEALLLARDYGIDTARAIPAYAFDVEDAAVARQRIAEKAGRARRSLLFVGGFGHPPNREGILWFADEVLPLLNADATRFELRIVGSKAPQDVLDLRSATIDVCGFVDDDELSSLYAQADIAIAPLLHGAGVKGKVIEAMSIGIPVVTTSIGAQGLPAPVSALVGIGDTPADFAAAIERTIFDASMTAERTERALAFVSQAYSSRAIAAVFHAAMPRLADIAATNKRR